MKLEQLAYEAYRAHTGGISLASGQPIPAWDALKPEIQAAWDTSTAAVLTAAINRFCMDEAHNPQSADYPDQCGMCEVRLKKLPESVRALVAEEAAHREGGCHA